VIRINTRQKLIDPQKIGSNGSQIGCKPMPGHHRDRTDPMQGIIETGPIYDISGILRSTYDG
jgi:hypothetical protein